MLSNDCLKLKVNQHVTNTSHIIHKDTLRYMREIGFENLTF